TPIKTDDGFSIVIALIASKVQDLLKDELSLIMMIIIILTAIITILAKLIGSNRLKESSFFYKLFYVSPFWTLTRILAAVFAIMVYFKLGSEAIYGENTGQLLLGDLLHV